MHSFNINNKPSQHKQPIADSQKNLLPNVGSLPYLRYWVEGGQFIFVTIPATISTIKPPKYISTVTGRVEAHINQYRHSKTTFRKSIMPLEIELLGSNDKFAFIREKDKVKINDLSFDNEFHTKAMEYYVASINELIPPKEFDIESLKNDTRFRIEKNDPLSIALTEAQNSRCPSKPNTAGDMKSESSSSESDSDGDAIMMPEAPTTLQNSNIASRPTPPPNSPHFSAAAGNISSQKNLPSASNDQNRDSYMLISNRIAPKPNETPADADIEMGISNPKFKVNKYSNTTRETLNRVFGHTTSHPGGGPNWVEQPYPIITSQRNN